MPGTTYKLYGRKGAGSLAVQIVLEEIGAAYELIWVGKANVYEAALRYFYPERYSTAGEAAGAQIKERALADWTGHFEIVHAALSPYVLGPTLSAADFYPHMFAGWFTAEDRAPASRLPKFRIHADLLRRRLSTRKAEADHEEA